MVVNMSNAYWDVMGNFKVKMCVFFREYLMGKPFTYLNTQYSHLCYNLLDTARASNCLLLKECMQHIEDGSHHYLSSLDSRHKLFNYP